MNSRTLAKALRRRQLRAGLASRWSINALPDGEILDAYLRCAKCNGDLFADRAAAVEESQSVAEFLALCNTALAAHKCENRN